MWVSEKASKVDHDKPSLLYSQAVFGYSVARTAVNQKFSFDETKNEPNLIKQTLYMGWRK